MKNELEKLVAQKVADEVWPKQPTTGVGLELTLENLKRLALTPSTHE